MKKLIATLCALAAIIPADAAFVYVTGNKVNLRQEPNTASPVLATAGLGDIFPVNETDADNDEWIQIEYAKGPDSQFPYISRKFVKVLADDAIPVEVLEQGFMFDDGTNFGMLQFENPEEGRITYTLMVKNREMQEAGGTGTIDSQYSTVSFADGILASPDDWIDVSPAAVYDAATGLLWFAGYLWEQ